MRQIDLNDPVQRAGAVYFVVGRGTEGGNDSYKVSVAGVGMRQWGDTSAVAADSGYSIGAIQVDLGKRGTWPLGAISNRPLQAGEKTYVDAIVDQAAEHARNNHLPFPNDTAGLARLRSDLLSHGNGQLHFLSESHRDSLNAWASSENGKQWIHQNIDFPQVQALADSAQEALDKYGKNIPEERRFEVMSILAKTGNQLPAVQQSLVRTLATHQNDPQVYDRFMEAVDQTARLYRFYDGPKAGQLAQQYLENYQKPGHAIAIEEAHRQVADPDYQPAWEGRNPVVQTALRAYRSDLNDPSVLDRGDKGESVGLLQEAMAQKGLPLRIDQDFGKGTESRLQDFQRSQQLPPTGFGDMATLRALGIAPSLDARSEGALTQLNQTLKASGRFTDAQCARIGESAYNFLLENRASLGEVSQIHLSKDASTLLFRNDFSQMRELDVQTAIKGYVPSQPIVQAPAQESPARATEPPIVSR